MTMQTPLRRVRGLGSAKSGTEHFWLERLTGLFALPLTIFWIWFIVTHLGASRAEVTASFQSPLIAVLMLATLANVFWHMKLGMDVIVEDYVKGHGARLALIVGNIAFCGGLFLVAAFSILKMSFGS